MSLTFANYALQPIYLDCAPSDFVVCTLASSIIVVLTAINCYKVRWATRIQDYSTVAKIGALLVISVVGFVYLAMGNYLKTCA
jgi:amino acid transporter